MAGGEVSVARGADLNTSGGQTQGMIRKNAIVDKSNQLCGSVMIAKPHSASDVHHHGEEGMLHKPLTPSIMPPCWSSQCSHPTDTIVYAASGRGTVVSGPNGSIRHDLAPGDFALIPAFTEHQEANDSDEDVVWIITRGGRNPIVQNLTGWGGENQK